MKKILILLVFLLTSCTFNVEHLVAIQTAERVKPRATFTWQPNPIPTQYPVPPHCDKETIILPCIWIADETIGESWESISNKVYGLNSYAIYILNWNRDKNGFSPVTMGELYIPSYPEIVFNLFPLKSTYSFGYSICTTMPKTKFPCVAKIASDNSLVSWDTVVKIYNVPKKYLREANLVHDGTGFKPYPKEFIKDHFILIPKTGD